MNSQSTLMPVLTLGHLQVRIMHSVWKHGEVCVHDVAADINGKPDAQRLAYTTFLTVMRTLVRRGMLCQEPGTGRAHRFRARIDESTYKTTFLRQILNDYFDGDAEALIRHLRAGDRGPTNSVWIEAAKPHPLDTHS